VGRRWLVILPVSLLLLGAVVCIDHARHDRIGDSAVAAAFKRQGIAIVPMRSPHVTEFVRRDAAQDPLALRVLVLSDASAAGQFARSDAVYAANRGTTVGPVVSPLVVKNIVIEFDHNAGLASRVRAAAQELQ